MRHFLKPMRANSKASVSSFILSTVDPRTENMLKVVHRQPEAANETPGWLRTAVRGLTNRCAGDKYSEQIHVPQRSPFSNGFIGRRLSCSSAISSDVKNRWPEFYWESQQEGPNGDSIYISQRRRLVDQMVPVEQPRSSVGVADLTGLRIWEASRVLSYYLWRRRDVNGDDVRGLSACELGSGTGLSGIFAAALGMNVVLTDPAKPLNYAKGLAGNTMDVLQHNAQRNRERCQGNMWVEKLLWGCKDDIDAVLESPAAPFDVILGADLMYSGENETMLKTIDALSHADTKVFLAYSRRHDGEQRFQDLASERYNFNVVVESLTMKGEVDVTATQYRLMTLTRRH